MKRLLLASSALVIGIGGQASAVPPPPPIYNWTGYYLGGHIGGAWDHTSFSDPGQFQFVAPLGDSRSLDGGSGFLGGFQGGYNYQFANGWVVGVNGSFSWIDLNDVQRDLFFGGKFSRARTDTLASLTGRFGYGQNNFLFYGTGGVGWAHNQYIISNVSGLGNTICPTGCDASASTNRTGWVLGAGVEWGISQNWSAMLEFNHYGFASKDLVFVTPNILGADARFGVKQDIDVIRFGANYRFGGWGPPIR
jgi:outer membrane immunogenic protein